MLGVESLEAIQNPIFVVHVRKKSANFSQVWILPLPFQIIAYQFIGNCIAVTTNLGDGLAASTLGNGGYQFIGNGIFIPNFGNQEIDITNLSNVFITNLQVMSGVGFAVTNLK